MPHSTRQRKALGKGLVSTTFGFQKTGGDVVQLFEQKLPTLAKN
jgi:hypothetical protein